MGKEIVFDYSKTAGFISEEEMKNMKSTVMGAKDVLTAKSGAGNDYLGWIDLPVVSFFALLYLYVSLNAQIRNITLLHSSSTSNNNYPDRKSVV